MARVSDQAQSQKLDMGCPAGCFGLPCDNLGKNNSVIRQAPLADQQVANGHTGLFASAELHHCCRVHHKKRPRWGPFPATIDADAALNHLQLAGKYLASMSAVTLPAAGAAEQVQVTWPLPCSAPTN